MPAACLRNFTLESPCHVPKACLETIQSRCFYMTVRTRGRPEGRGGFAGGISVAGGACGGLNIQHPTSNIQHRSRNLAPRSLHRITSASRFVPFASYWKLDVGCWMLDVQPRAVCPSMLQRSSFFPVALGSVHFPAGGGSFSQGSSSRSSRSITRRQRRSYSGAPYSASQSAGIRSVHSGRKSAASRS